MKLNKYLVLTGSALLFLVTVARNVYVAGLNPDDWRSLSDDMIYPLMDADRWLAYVLTNHVNPNIQAAAPFPTGLQLVVAFVLCFWTARMLARIAADDDWLQPATLAIFAAGITHAYFADIISYNEFIAANTLCLAAPVFGFTLMLGKERTWLTYLIAAQALAYTIAVYPTFVLIGTIVPIVALMRVDRYGFAESIGIVARSLALFALGAVLFVFEQYLASLVFESGVSVQRFHFADAQALAAKFAQLPTIIQWVHSTSLSETGNRLLRLLSLLASAGIFAFSVLAAISVAVGRSGPERYAAFGRVLVSTLTLMIILPVSFWTLYADYSFPGRTLGFYGFGLATLLIASIHLISRSAIPMPLLLRGGAAGILGVMVVVGAMVSATFAGILGEAAARDRVLADQILEQIAELQDFEGRYVNIVGGVQYDDLRWGRFLPASSFGVMNEYNAALAPYLDLDRWAAHIPVGPIKCPSFPTPGSVFARDGIAYVCLTARDIGWNSASCAALQRVPATACFGPDYAAFFIPDCAISAFGTGTVRLTYLNAAGEPVAEATALSDSLGRTPVGTGCGFFASVQVLDFDSVVLTGFGMHDDQLWEEELSASALEDRPAFN